jgi:hypothetical protein
MRAACASFAAQYRGSNTSHSNEELLEVIERKIAESLVDGAHPLGRVVGYGEK